MKTMTPKQFAPLKRVIGAEQPADDDKGDLQETQSTKKADTDKKEPDPP